MKSYGKIALLSIISAVIAVVLLSFILMAFIKVIDGGRIGLMAGGLVLHAVLMGFIIRWLLRWRRPFLTSIVTNLTLVLVAYLLLIIFLGTPLGCRQFGERNLCGLNVDSPGMRIILGMLGAGPVLLPLGYGLTSAGVQKYVTGRTKQ